MDYRTCLLLIKSEFYETKNRLMWAIAVTIIICTLRILIGNLDSNHITNGIQSIYLCVNFFLSILAFSNLKYANDTRQYLLIPATLIEKIASKLTFYTIGWSIIFISCWIIACIIASAINFVTFGCGFLNLFILAIGFKAIFYDWISAILIPSIAIFASCYFKRMIIIKLGICYLFIYSPINNLIRSELDKLIYDNMISTTLVSIAYQTFQILAIAIIWILIYLRLKETEAIQ